MFTKRHRRGSVVQDAAEEGREHRPLASCAHLSGPRGRRGEEGVQRVRRKATSKSARADVAVGCRAPLTVATAVTASSTPRDIEPGGSWAAWLMHRRYEARRIAKRSWSPGDNGAAATAAARR